MILESVAEGVITILELAAEAIVEFFGETVFDAFARIMAKTSPVITALIIGFIIFEGAMLAHSAQPSSGADNDPMLAAMQQELDREKQLLVLPGMQRPYFMEYRLEDLESYEAVSNYGALTRESQNHQRVVRVTVRIGDYVTDSSSARGDGSLQLAPGDNDADALKFALWTATDEAYKNALRAYAAKQAALKRFQSLPTADDFTPAKAVTSIEPLAKLDLDRAEWKKRIGDASGL